jgi:hypothetical protein
MIDFLGMQSKEWQLLLSDNIIKTIVLERAVSS